jgi:sugar lactone lactonase YvrE
MQIGIRVVGLLIGGLGVLPAQRPDPTAYDRARDSVSVRPVNRGRIAFVVPQKDLLAESVAYDSVTGSFFIGSTRHGNVTRISGGQTSAFIPTGRDGMWMVIGIKADAARRNLWVNTSGGANFVNHQAADAGKAALYRFDLDNGLMRKRYVPQDSGRHFFNDAVVADDGQVYVTDMLAGAVYRVSRSDSLELWSRSELLQRPNGIALSSDQRTLFVAVSGGIVAMDTRDRAAVRLTAADGMRVAGIDGLYAVAGGLVTVQGGSQNLVQFLALDSARMAITSARTLEAHHPMMMNPTTGVIVGGEIFVIANSQFSSFESDGRLYPPARLFETVVLGIPLAATPPSRRNSHVMTAAPDGGVLMLAGASGRTPRNADTLWAWSGREWLPRSSSGPHARNLPAAALDTRRNVVVVYGGSGVGNGTRFGDTWEWDGQSWRERVVQTPGPRDHHAMAYDAARGKMVVYGGLVGSSLVGGTWTWDGTAWQLADSTSGPLPVGHHAMAYDAKRQRVVMYGGLPANGERLGETWEWDGARWERITTAGSPGPRSHHRMAYDAARGVVVLFGGGDSTSTDTWTYDGRAWVRQTIVGPPARWSSAMAYDARRQRIVLFGGGRSARPFGSLADTWEWDGSAWHDTGREP